MPYLTNEIKDSHDRLYRSAINAMQFVGRFQMQLASVTKIYKGRSSHEAVMTLQLKDGGEEFSICMPASSAEVIALEGHGLNNRRSTYSIFSGCVAFLGGAFGSVVITFVDSEPANAVMAIARDERIVSWIGGNIVELVAFALRVQLPIYVNSRWASDNVYPPPQNRNTPMPQIFADALSDILRTGRERAHGASEEEREG